MDGARRRGRLGTRAWLDELVLGTEAQYGHREAAMWVGLNYAIPLAKAGNLPNAPTAIALRPSTRLDLQVGFVFRTGKDDDWDLFAYYTWLDRGEASRPETRLPFWMAASTSSRSCWALVIALHQNRMTMSTASDSRRQACPPQRARSPSFFGRVKARRRR